jgi:hypothetical protein
MIDSRSPSVAVQEVLAVTWQHWKQCSAGGRPHAVHNTPRRSGGKLGVLIIRGMITARSGDNQLVEEEGEDKVVTVVEDLSRLWWTSVICQIGGDCMPGPCRLIWQLLVSGMGGREGGSSGWMSLSC